jgi:hypothetical protein
MIPPIALARIPLGAYLFVHYVQLVPFAASTFGRGGILPHASMTPGYPFAPSPLYWLDSPSVVVGLMVALALVSLAYLAGFRTRTAGFLLFLGSYSLFHRNELTQNPSLAFLGLWFLAHPLLPASPPLSIDRWLARRRGEKTDSSSDAVPRDVLTVLWIVMAVAYSYSGWTKLDSPSWRSGEALALLLNSPLARDGMLVNAVLRLPSWLLVAGTWSMLAAELVFAPVALFPAARPYLWGVLTLMHVGIAGLMNIADISIAMIAFHLVTFDPAWLKTWEKKAQPDAPLVSREGVFNGWARHWGATIDRLARRTLL